MIDAPIIHFIGTLRYISSGLYATFHRDSTLHFIETRKQGYSPVQIHSRVWVGKAKVSGRVDVGGDEQLRKTHCSRRLSGGFSQSAKEILRHPQGEALLLDPSEQTTCEPNPLV